MKEKKLKMEIEACCFERKWNQLNLMFRLNKKQRNSQKMPFGIKFSDEYTANKICKKKTNKTRELF